MGVEEDIVIDIDALKNNYEKDPLSFHIWYTAIDCKRKRDAYWRHYKNMSFRSNLISIPLLLITSATGLTSVANLSSVNPTPPDSSFTVLTLPAIVTCFGVSSALLSALQRYFRYSERSEHAKHIAKAYGRIARRIENTMILLKSKATAIKPETFEKFIEELQKETDSLLQETDEIPSELLNHKDIYKTTLDTFVRDKHMGSSSTEFSHCKNVVQSVPSFICGRDLDIENLENMNFVAARMEAPSRDSPSRDSLYVTQIDSS